MSLTIADYQSRFVLPGSKSLLWLEEESWVTDGLLLEVSGGKESVSTDTETPFIFADVTDYLLDVGSDIHDVHIAVRRTGGGVADRGGSVADRGSELALVTDPLNTQRMSQIRDDWCCLPAYPDSCLHCCCHYILHILTYTYALCTYAFVRYLYVLMCWDISSMARGQVWR